MAVDPLQLTRFVDQEEYRALSRGGAGGTARPSLAYKTRLATRYSTRKGVAFEKFDTERARGQISEKGEVTGAGVPLGDERTYRGIPSLPDEDLLETALRRPGSARMEDAHLIRGFVVAEPDPIDRLRAPDGVSVPRGHDRRLSPTARHSGFDIDGETNRIVQVAPGLIRPIERRRQLKMELDLQRAEKRRRGLVSRRNRLRGIIERAYPDGIRGVLPSPRTMSPPAADLPNLHEKAERTRQKQEHIHRVAVSRASTKAQWEDSRVRRGYDLIAPDRPVTVGPKPTSTRDGTVITQARKRNPQMIEHEAQTSQRLFAAGDIFRPNPRRVQQHILNDTRGRNYDVVTNMVRENVI